MISLFGGQNSEKWIILHQIAHYEATIFLADILI